MSHPAKNAAAPAAPSQMAPSSGSDEVEFVDVDVIVDSDGKEIVFENEQDQANLLMMMDLNKYLSMVDKSNNNSQSAASGDDKTRQAQKKQNDDDDDDDDDDAEKEHLERIFGRQCSAAAAAGAAAATAASAPALDYSSIFKRLEQRTQLANAGELEEEDRVMLDKQKQLREQEESEELKRIHAEEHAAAEKQQEQERKKKNNNSNDNGGEGDEDEDEDEDEVFADEEGMQQSMRSTDCFVREETDPEEWKLQRIIARKTVAVSNDRDDDGDDADLYEDDDEAVGRSVTSRRKKRKEHVYHCVWQRGYTTWELQSTLVETGFKTAVLAFDEEISEKARTAKSAVRTDFKPPSQYSSIAGYRPSAPPAPPKKTDLGIIFRPLTPHQKVFEDLFPNIEEQVAAKFRACNLSIPDRICSALCPTAAENFINKYKGTAASKSQQPLFLFHGSNAVKGILDKGLMVPGQGGVKVVCGQAYTPSTPSIYTAASPSTSVGYVRGEQVMFVCAGNVQGGLQHAGGAIVTFSDSDDIVPIFIVRFQPRQIVAKPIRFYDIHQFNTLKLPGESDGSCSAEQREMTEEEKTKQLLAGLAPSVRKKVLRLKKRELEYKEGRR